MDWIFTAFVGAAIVHVVEEFLYPGGFMDVMKRFNPQFTPFVTVRFAVIINGLFLLLCVLAAIVGRNNLVFSLSVASLLFINALVHIGATLRARGYAPGIASSILLYLPLSLYAYYVFISSGQMAWPELVASGLLGVLYQAVPVSYLLLSSARRA
jgi:hypothetical protein